MHVRYWISVIGIFALLLLTILASIFGWGLQPSSLATTMVVNPRPETGLRHSGHFHLWRTPFIRPKGHP